MNEIEKQERLLAYYGHVYEAANFILEWTQGFSPEAFRNDLLRVSAVERQFEIVGEASKRIRDVLGEKHPKESDWFGAMKLRDFLAHRYECVNSAFLLKTAREDIPQIRQLAKDALGACEAALGQGPGGAK